MPVAGTAEMVADRTREGQAGSADLAELPGAWGDTAEGAANQAPAVQAVPADLAEGKSQAGRAEAVAATVSPALGAPVASRGLVAPAGERAARAVGD
jgi:hypothetical protein